jgi:hypothetical protein
MNRRNQIESRARGGYGDWDQDRGGPEDRDYYERGSGGYGGYDRAGNWDRDRDRRPQGASGSGYGGGHDRDRWTNSPRGGYYDRDRDYTRGRGDYERGYEHGYAHGRSHGYGSSSGYEPGYDRDREGPYREELYGRDRRYGDERDRARYGTGNIDVERGGYGREGDEREREYWQRRR